MGLFKKIVDGEIPCHKVWEDDNHLAFLDIRPIRPGHTLVIPKREVDYVFDLEPAAYDALWAAVRTVSERIQSRLQCKRVCLAVIGWEVPHVHVHLVPTDDITHFPPPPGTVGPSQGELAAMARRLAQD